MLRTAVSGFNLIFVLVVKIDHPRRPLVTPRRWLDQVKFRISLGILTHRIQHLHTTVITVQSGAKHAYQLDSQDTQKCLAQGSAQARRPAGSC